MVLSRRGGVSHCWGGVSPCRPGRAAVGMENAACLLIQRPASFVITFFSVVEDCSLCPSRMWIIQCVHVRAPAHALRYGHTDEFPQPGT